MPTLVIYYYTQLKEEGKPYWRILYIITRNYSDSASGGSKGTLFVSANMDIKIK